MKDIWLNVKSTKNEGSAHRKIEVTDQDGNPIRGITSLKYDCKAPFHEQLTITVIPEYIELQGLKPIIEENSTN